MNLRSFLAVGLSAAMFASVVPQKAQATHQIGHFVGGVVAGALIAGALNANRGVVYNPGPTYVYQPRQCRWIWQDVCTPYQGCYRRQVQVC
ncbi:MAG: hypothetical protein KDK08_24460 [Rhizobiaceae bacterium]|nr:hypothetical protein [Rhizobiaceae bacterium]